MVVIGGKAFARIVILMIISFSQKYSQNTAKVLGASSNAF